MKIFQYAVIYKPSKENKTEQAKIVVQPTTILAEDEKSAFMVAARSIPEEYVAKLSECEVAVRPF